MNILHDKYYLHAADLGQGYPLVGEVTRLGKNEYQFNYCFKEFPLPYMEVRGMPDTLKVYDTSEVMQSIFGRLWCFDKSNWRYAQLLEMFNLKEIEEPWQILELANIKAKDTPWPLCNPQRTIVLSEKVLG